MPTTRVMRLLSVAAVAPLLLSSCDSNNPFDPSDDAVGSYELTVFAGRGMPSATIDCTAAGECPNLPSGGRVVVSEGSLVLYNDGTFVETNLYTETPTGGTPQDRTYSSAGTYEVFDNDITLSAPGQSRLVDGSITSVGGQIRINYIEDGEAYEYRR